MTALDQHALDSAITEFVRVFQPPRLTGDPETDRDDYASAVGEAVESAIETYLHETAANGDTLADFLEPDDWDEPTDAEQCECTFCKRHVAADAQFPESGWLPVCRQHQNKAWDRGLLVRAHQAREFEGKP